LAQALPGQFYPLRDRRNYWKTVRFALKVIMDSIANMIVTIKNGYLARKDEVVLPFSKFKFEVAKVLEKAGFVKKVTKSENNVKVELLYTEDKKPRITEIKKVSKQGLRIYTKSKNIRPVKGGRGVTVISTPKGVMTQKEAQKRNLGGEVICRVW